MSLSYHQRNAVIRNLFEMAWRDGVVTEPERAVLQRLLVTLGVPAERAQGMLEQRGQRPPPEAFLGPIEELAREVPSHEDRLAAVRMLVELCLSDGAVFAELEYLFQLAMRIQLGAGELEELFRTCGG